MRSVWIVAGSVVFGWLFERSRGNLLVAVLAHAGVHLDNPTHSLASAPKAYAVFTAAVCAAAAALIVLERARRRSVAAHFAVFARSRAPTAREWPTRSMIAVEAPGGQGATKANTCGI